MAKVLTLRPVNYQKKTHAQRMFITDTRQLKLTWIFICFLLFLQPAVNGQEMLGVTFGNYSGINGVMINPATMTNSKNFLDINIIAADYFFFNNAAYIPAADVSIYDLWKPGFQFPTYGEKQSNLLYYKNQKTKAATMNFRLQGPSAMFNYGKHSFGITTAVRYFISGNNVPWEIPVFGFESLKYEPLQNIAFDNFAVDFSTTVWMQIGISYAYNIYNYQNNSISIGASLNTLWGYAGAYGDVSNANYILLNDSTINIRNLDAQVGFALPVDYYTNDLPMNEPFFKGKGLGLDIGVTYVKKKYVGTQRWQHVSQQSYEEYIYRVGLSFIDIGRIKYSKNAQLIDYDNVSAFWQNFDTISYDNVNQVIEQLSNVFYGDPNASFAGNTIKIGLPTAVSLQFDYNYRNNIFFGVFLIQPIRINRNTLRRPAQIAFIPRYETKQLEFSLPISLYDYRYPRVGFAARFSFFTIGTERLGTYLGLADLNGADIYMAVKINFGKDTYRFKSHSKCYNNEYGYSDKEKVKFKK